MDELFFDVYQGLNVCAYKDKCDECPYKDVKDMNCIDALMLDTLSILENIMTSLGFVEENPS